MTGELLQTQSAPAWTTAASKQMDPSLGAESVISSEEETDCESDRGSCTPLRDHQARLEAYMARKGVKRSAFQQRFGADSRKPLRPLADGLSPCWLRPRTNQQELLQQQQRMTDPMAIPATKTNGYQGWDEDVDEDCRCGNDCGFFQDDASQDAALQGLDDMIFDLEI
ncbi:hypothetical protein Gpo141_00005564 [Globisporangium polare]